MSGLEIVLEYLPFSIKKLVNSLCKDGAEFGKLDMRST